MYHRLGHSTKVTIVTLLIGLLSLDTVLACPWARSRRAQCCVYVPPCYGPPAAGEAHQKSSTTRTRGDYGSSPGAGYGSPADGGYGYPSTDGTPGYAPTPASPSGPARFEILPEEPPEAPAEAAPAYSPEFFPPKPRENFFPPKPNETSTEPEQPLRQWVDNTGKFQVQARLVQVLDGKVRLQKENGRLTTVPMKRLGTQDREYVASLWVDNTGKFQIHARLVEVLDGEVRLMKGNGKLITVPLNRLGAAERKFVQELLEAPQEIGKVARR